MKRMNTPESREEFERNIHMLIEQIRQKKFHLPKGHMCGIDEIRPLPNGRIDMLSVNEMARLSANQMNNMPDLSSFGEAQDR